MSNLGYSFIPVHPGEIIKEELQSRGISQKRFAEVVGVSYTMLNGSNPVSLVRLVPIPKEQRILFLQYS